MPKTVFKPKTKLTGLFPVPENYVKGSFAGRGKCPDLVKFISPAIYPLASWSHS